MADPYMFDIIASLEDAEPYTINDYAFDIVASLEGDYIPPMLEEKEES